MAEAEPQWMTPKEFLARHAGHISSATLYRHIARGAIPVAQPFGKGGRILIPENALSLVMQERGARIGARNSDRG